MIPTPHETSAENHCIASPRRSFRARARHRRWASIAAAALTASLLAPAGAAAQGKDPFEFHGYMRSGFGVNGELGDLDPFRAPGAPAGYRLGNEAETYIELTFQANWLDGDAEGPWLLTRVTPAMVTGNNSTFDQIQPFALREAYAEAGRLFASQPAMSFWAGHRFYRRHDVHINDFYYWDMSGPGAGFQDLDLGFGKLAVAWLGGSRDDQISVARGRFTKNNLDVRLYEIDAGVGMLTIGFTPVVALGGDPGAGEPESTHGAAGTLMLTQSGVLGGYNKASIQIGYGGGATLNTSIGSASDGWIVRAVEQAQIRASPAVSMMGTAVVQLENIQGDENGANLWLSAGVRPTLHLGRYTALLIEAGMDLVQPRDPDGNGPLSPELGFLGKLTVAPTIKAGESFWSRPEIRLFLTAALWNEVIQGQVGGDAYADDTFGISFGVQAESWW